MLLKQERRKTDDFVKISGCEGKLLGKNFDISFPNQKPTFS